MVKDDACKIRREFEKKLGEPDNADALNEYIEMVIGAKYDSGQKHHILPRSVFPEFDDFVNNPWNCVILPASAHMEAHRLLFMAYQIRAFQRTLNWSNHFDRTDAEYRAAISEAAKKGWRNMTAETREKWLDKRRAHMKTAMVPGNKTYDAIQAGSIKSLQTPERLSALSNSGTRHWGGFTAEERSATLKDRMSKPETRKKMSDSMRERYADQAYRANHAALMGVVNADANKRNAAGAKIKELWKTEEFSKKCIESRKTDAAVRKRYLSNMKKAPDIWIHAIAARELYDSGVNRHRIGIILGISPNGMFSRFEDGFMPSTCPTYLQFKEWYEANQS